LFSGPVAAVKGALSFARSSQDPLRPGRVAYAGQRGKGAVGVCARSSRGFWRRVQASRAADAALVPTPQIVSRVQAANIFRLLSVIGLFPFLFSVCRSFETIARKITSNAKRTPKPTHAARVELAPTCPTRLNQPPSVILPCSETPADRWRRKNRAVLMGAGAVGGVLVAA
jgi:hypothetical protein